MGIIIKLLLIIGILYLILKNSRLNDPFLKKVCWLGLAARLSLTLLLFFISSGMGNYGFWAFGADAVKYHRQGIVIADSILQGVMPLINAANIYPYIIGLIYTIFGKHLLSAVFINNLLGTLVIIIGYLLVREAYSHKTARVTALLLAFFPSHILFSTQALRDVIVMFLFGR